MLSNTPHGMLIARIMRDELFAAFPASQSGLLESLPTVKVCGVRMWRESGSSRMARVQHFDCGKCYNLSAFYHQRYNRI